MPSAPAAIKTRNRGTNSLPGLPPQPLNFDYAFQARKSTEVENGPFSRGRPQIGITFGRRYKVLHAGWRFCIASALSAICLEKEMMRGTMPVARRRGRSRTAWMDNIKTWAGLSAEESIRTTEDSDKWRKNVHGVANPRIEDG